MKPTPVMVMDLLSSKKFKALLALVLLWTETVRTAIGLDVEALKWLTGAFAAYFVSQTFRDLGEELVKAIRIYRGTEEKKANPPEGP